MLALIVTESSPLRKPWERMHFRYMEQCQMRDNLSNRQSALDVCATTILHGDSNNIFDIVATAVGIGFMVRDFPTRLSLL
jgi:hypothetical protein